MTSTDRLAIVNPARGLLIYQIDAPEGFWYFDGSSWAQLGGSGGGGGTNIVCASPSGNETARYDATNGQWECSKMLQIMKETSGSYVSIGNNFTPSSRYFTLWIRDRDTVTYPPDPTIYYYDVTRVGIGYSPYSSSSVALSVDGGAHIDDGLRVGTTSTPPTDGILSYGEIKTTYGDITVGSTSNSFNIGSYSGITTTLSYIASISTYTKSVYVATAAASTASHSAVTVITSLSMCTKSFTIKGGIIVGAY